MERPRRRREPQHRRQPAAREGAGRAQTGRATAAGRAALDGVAGATITASSRSHREAILDAAERAFADRGFAGASVREIAADVGLKNQASLYHYFEDKRALYEAVLERCVQTIVGIWRAEGGDPGAPAAGLAPVLDFLDAHPHLARLTHRAGIDEDAYARSAAARILSPLYQRGLEMLRDAPAPWPAAQLPHLAAGLYHLIFGYYASAPLLREVSGDDPYSALALARQRQFVLTAVAQLLGAPPRARS